jgi:carbamoyl-phosphate synthase large subunit
MPIRTDIKSILLLGSGPIQIGQGCEFDYSGTQACRALRELGFRVVLMNSNPATIMTDPETADAIYIEPMTLDAAREIIIKEKPDAILPTMGGQVGLNLFLALYDAGVLQEYGVRNLGVDPETIHLTEDRRSFRDLVLSLGMDVPRGGLARTLEEGLALSGLHDLPLVVRASYALGGSGGGIVTSRAELQALLQRAFSVSGAGEVAIEESLVGWKEYELEVMRDEAGNFVVVCGIENVNPMGVHTGDSITVAPCMTLTDKEYQGLRDAAEKIFMAVGMRIGGANIQFAVHPDTGRVVVIEMNPRVSRSSALVSKATGYPIARVSARLAVGCLLSELTNEITGNTSAAFEPAIDYVAVKIPRFDSEKFPEASPNLGVQMKSVGEVLAFGRNFKDAFQKAWRSLEQGYDGWPASNLIGDELERALATPTPHLFLHIKRAMQLGMSVEKLHAITRIGRWFLSQCAELIAFERKLSSGELNQARAFEAKQLGFTNARIAALLRMPELRVTQLMAEYGVVPTYKIVDTCAAEFQAKTPYYFKTFEFENENVRDSSAERIVILGSGPNRIGQGIEFDYSCVHAVRAVQSIGKRAILVNCNPETVSTDFNVSDKLFMEPLHVEDVLQILAEERPSGVLLQFGGQSALKLAEAIGKSGYNILGSQWDVIDLAEDRARFATLLDEINVAVPPWDSCLSVDDALHAAQRIKYPLLVRPSFVLGGRAMRVVRNEAELREFVTRALEVSAGSPVHIDKYLEDALEFDVDLICDGAQCFVPAIIEHLEEAGIHSGDSTSVIPPVNASEHCLQEIVTVSRKLALALGVVGLMNIQFAYHSGVLYVIEANPRSSRTVPFVAKATGIPLARLGALVAMGMTVSDALAREGVVAPVSSETVSATTPRQFAVKTPVFPFQKFPESAPFLGPEMRSIGEVMTTASSLPGAVRKGLLAAGMRCNAHTNRVVIALDAGSVRVVRDALRLLARKPGFTLVAEESLACEVQRQCGLDVMPIEAKRMPEVCRRMFASGDVAALLAPNSLGEPSELQSELGRMAVQYRIPFSNSTRAAITLAETLVGSRVERSVLMELSAQ